MNSDKVKVLARIALLVLGFTLTFGLAEVAMRIMVPSAPACEEPRATPGAPVIERIFDFARPNINGVMVCNVPYRTNRFGFRGPEVAEEKPAGVFRIVIGGDSVTMGSGVPEHQVYARKLQDLLNDDSQKHPVYETLNLGIAGLPIRQIVTRIETVGLPLDPDLIVYGWTINDIEGAHYRMRVSKEKRRSWVEEARGFAASPSRLFAMMGPRVVALWRSGEPTYRSELFDNYLENEKAWSDFTSQLDRLAEIQRRAGVCTVVFLHTHLYTLDAGHPFLNIYDKVERAALERGLFTATSFPAFSGRTPTALWVAPANSHPNALGNSILAEALLRGLEELPARCWRDRIDRH